MKRQEWLDAHELEIGNWHDFVLCQIADALEDGLPEIYGTDQFGFLCDLFGGDMPHSSGSDIVSQNILSDDRFAPLHDRWLDKFGDCFWHTDEIPGEEECPGKIS